MIKLNLYKLITVTLVTIVILCCIIKFTNLNESFYAYKYDLRTQQKFVESRHDIKSIFNSFEKVSYEELTQEYKKKKTKSEIPKYQNLLSGIPYYKIKGAEIFKYLVADFRVKDFLPKDEYYFENTRNLKFETIIYTPLNPELIYKLLHLMQELDQAGYNRKGFKIVNGHRHPKYNEEVGGAALSRHIKGEALDLLIKDINFDGRVTQADKSIVLDLLENEVIKASGGIGRYPGTMSVHFDVRGYKARWDKQ